jgi:hypothetical protein
VWREIWLGAKASEIACSIAVRKGSKWSSAIWNLNMKKSYAVLSESLERTNFEYHLHLNNAEVVEKTQNM